MFPRYHWRELKESFMPNKGKGEDPRPGSSLLPMLVVGLVLIVIGMIGALVIS